MLRGRSDVRVDDADSVRWSEENARLMTRLGPRMTARWSLATRRQGRKPGASLSTRRRLSHGTGGDSLVPPFIYTRKRLSLSHRVQGEGLAHPYTRRSPSHGGQGESLVPPCTRGSVSHSGADSRVFLPPIALLFLPLLSAHAHAPERFTASTGREGGEGGRGRGHQGRVEQFDPRWTPV